MSQLWGHEWLLVIYQAVRSHMAGKKLRTAPQSQSAIGWRSGKVPRGISAPQYTPPAIPLQDVSLPYFSPYPSRTSMLSSLWLPYFEAGAAVEVLEVGAEALGTAADAAGAGGVFTAAAVGAGVVGAAEL